MEVFISWSGARSRAVADALRNWLPTVTNAVEPWLSSTDIDKGARWGTDVAKRLQTSSVGIFCLTPGNLSAPWILFEAGALSKLVSNTFVCPYLIGVNNADVTGPLSQFQATTANRVDTEALVMTINRALEKPLGEDHVRKAFDKWWPDLEAKLSSLPDEAPAEPTRTDREVLEDILAFVREQARTSSDLAAARQINRSSVPTPHRIAMKRACVEAEVHFRDVTFGKSQDYMLMFDTDAASFGLSIPVSRFRGPQSTVIDNIAADIRKALDQEARS